MSLIRYLGRLARPLLYPVNNFHSTSAVKNIYYTAEHEIIQVETDENIVKIGITDYAKESLGDIVFFETEVEVGEEFSEEDCLVTIESVKASSEILAPFDGKVIEGNELDIDEIGELDEKDLWFVRCEVDNRDFLETLMNEDEYSIFIKKE